MSERSNSTGETIRYAYDANARRISETRPAIDEIVSTSYTPVDPADPVLLNDIRPRTIIRKISGVEVERTYYAYTTNNQDIVERASIPEAAYGAPGNLRTVTTWYPADLDDHAAGRIASVRHEDGQLDLYTYSWVDSVWTETVTRVHELEPDPVPMQTTRRVAIYGRTGNLIEERTELMTAPDVWEQIDGVAYEYDVNGRETKRTAFNGLTTVSAWSGTCCGKSSETAPDGTRTTFTYDTAGRVVVRTVLDPVPIETHIAYDALGRRVATWTTNRVAQSGTTVPGTPVLRTAYDALGRVVSRTDALGNATTYAYSADERTTTVTQPTGATQITVADAAGRVRTVSGTGAAPRFYTYGVNSDGTRWTKVFNGSDATAAAWIRRTADMLGRILRKEKPGYGNTLLATTYAYDNGGRVLNQTQNVISGSVSSVLSVDLSTYDLQGDLLFSALDVNQNGVIDFTGPDRITGHTSAFIVKDGTLWQESTQTVYPDFDSDRAVTTAKSRRKLTNLGAFVSVAETEDIRGNVTTATQTVDPGTGHAFATTTIPTSVQPQVQTQRFGLLVESISATAVTNRYAYDALNRRVAETDGRGNTTTTTYNGIGQVVTTAQIGSSNPVNPVILSSTSYVYDEYGRQVETIDALGQSTYTVYDLRGKVVKQYGATYPVWYEYDTEGRMIAMATTRDTTLDPATVDALDHPSLDKTQWNYDPATGLLVQKLYEDGKGPSYTYTPDGKLATRTWARGIVTEYAYDVLGSLLSVDYSDATPDVAYTYDRLGRQLSAIAAGVSTNLYVYSTNTLELVAETQNGVVIDRNTDTLGRASGLSLGDDYAVSYTHDTLGRFSQLRAFVSSCETNTFSYSYIPGSSLISGMTASSGHAWTRSYEPNRNLITSVTNSFNDNLISAFDYTNDAIGRRTARLDFQPAGVEITNAFGYNVRSEVTTAAMGTNTYGYVFDPIGNRIVSTNNAEIAFYIANGLNQYSAISNAISALPAYDDDGNMTAMGDGWHYMWNGENRLVLVSNDMYVVSFSYDHQGRMWLKTVACSRMTPVKSIRHHWDGYNIIAETITTDSATNTTYNIWGIDLTGTLQGADGVGGLLSVMRDGIANYPAFDANGNITEYASFGGTISAHRAYSQFGDTIVVKGDADSFSHWFSTKPWCSVIELNEYQYRRYSPVLGRWLSRDPLAEIFPRECYRFVDNSPVDKYDLFGLLSDSSCKQNADKFLATPGRYSAVLNDIVNEINKIPNCTLPTPDCECCEDEKATWKGYVDDGKLMLCSNNMTKDGNVTENMLETMAHEYLHILQGCREEDTQTCDGAVCTEIQAALNDGTCQRLYPDRVRDCVIASAAGSAKNRCGNDVNLAKSRARELYSKCNRPVK